MSRTEGASAARWTSCLLHSVLLLACARAVALDADIELAQVSHRAWGSSDLAPTQVRSIAQAADGTLWLASSAGVATFDSAKFLPTGLTYPSSNLTALATAKDRTLWVGDIWGGVTAVRSSGVTHFGQRDGLAAAPVHAVLQDSKGVIWVASDGGLFRLEDSRWQRLGPAQGLRDGPALGAFLARDGAVWLATNDGVFASSDGGNRFQRASSEPLTPNVPKYFAQAPDGDIWLSDPARGLLHIGPGSTTRPHWLLKGQAVGPLLFDREGSLWIGGDRLRRMTRTQQADATVEQLTRANGLSGDRVLSLFEDRDGFIWIGTELGLDRFRHADVVWVVTPHVGRNKVIVAGKNRVWVADEDGSLFAFDGPKLAKRLTAPRFTAGFRDRDGSVWFGGPKGIARLNGERLELTPLPPQAGGFDVQAMSRDAAGTVWVSVDRTGLFGLAQQRWITGPAALPAEAPLVATSDERGDVWFGYTNDRIAHLSGGSARLFTAADGLHVGNVTAIHAHGSRVWIGGELALSLFAGGQFTTIGPRSCQQFRAISGLFETTSNELWIFRHLAVSRLQRLDEELQRMEPANLLPCESFGSRDVPAPTPQQLRPTPSLTVAGDQRVWLAANEGLAWIDPARIQPQITVPPEVRIDAITTEEVNGSYQFVPQITYTLPVNVKNVRISYVGINLAIPESARFRYRLLGVDPEWIDTVRNDISYVNLSPGTYRFEVTAANRDYTLTTKPAAIDFVIPPAFYQTVWFRALCTLAGLVLLALFVRMQVRNANARLRMRLEDRMRERERIARDLHDTLLQGIQALVLRFQGVAARIPANEPARDLMERALDLADDVISEGRERVHDLREASGADLPQEIARVGKDFFQEDDVQFGVAVHGIARSLHPIVREEAFLIAREALANAHRHAGPRTVEVNVFYDRTGLRVSVRDDGRGMDADILRAGGREKHWGLRGMRERATRIRGSLEIWSRSGAGTEVELRVPASLAYQHTGRQWRWPWRHSR